MFAIVKHILKNTLFPWFWNKNHACYLNTVFYRYLYYDDVWTLVFWPQGAYELYFQNNPPFIGLFFSVFLIFCAMSKIWEIRASSVFIQLPRRECFSSKMPEYLLYSHTIHVRVNTGTKNYHHPCPLGWQIKENWKQAFCGAPAFCGARGVHFL